jgi:DNA mismatch repair protein MutL
VRRLPDALVDQIAAGEVVERPASVVKELVENALDAGAGRIRVEVREGGSAFVGVTDDGAGMTPEDARLALERHATSKIASSEDLARIASFGFRGEALPAIASVSRLRLRTRSGDAEEGYELEVEGGKLLAARAAGAPPGTRIEVADLFFNVPARRKFLKSPATEWTHVADWLARAALALPGVHFDLRRDDRPALSWPAVADPLDRIAAVLSEREAEGLVPAMADQGPVRVRGFVSRPDAHRANAGALYLFVQQRPVRDRLLRHALLDGYRDVLPRGRFPAALLFVDVPPEAVDVNVHPAKWEVRFADPAGIHRLVTRAVRDALAGRRWLGGGAAAPASTAASAVRVAEPDGDWIFARPPAAALEPDAGATEALPLREGQGREATPGVRFAEQRVIGQLLATYLLLETPGGLLLVDQHAAHERVLYERLRAAWRRRGVERQPLLLPATLELSPDAAARLAAAGGALEALGFEVESFGERTVAVRAIPALLAGRDPAALVAALAGELAASHSDAAALRSPEAADRLFASMACHSARRAGDRLEPREQQALLAALDEIPWAPTCPHGRPVATRLTREEIERRFGRS